jgi:hypothetical protein
MTDLKEGTLAIIRVKGALLRATWGFGGGHTWWPGHCIAWWPEPGQRRKFPVGLHGTEVVRVISAGRGVS